jgi:UDP-N-acetylglucosamine--N-acetylmuramyl-(pentapeptide) pyrophosphoryl-undecaprenol N-acetylglucosamine transferase
MPRRREKTPSQGPTYVLTGGGTAGHVYPALAIAEAIRERSPGARFLFLGVKYGAEVEIVPRFRHLVAEHDLRFVGGRGMPTDRFSPAMLRFLGSLFLGTLRAIRLLARIRPFFVIGTGGYASAATLYAARLLAFPYLLNEQNAEPGKVTRAFGKSAAVVAVAFSGTLRYFPGNGALVGYPVREAIRRAAAEDYAAHRDSVRRELGVRDGQALVLVTGGSLGARSINRSLVRVVARVAADPALRGAVFFVHGVGRNASAAYHAWKDTMARLADLGLDPATLTDFYRPARYLFDIERHYAAADVLCCRGGAGSLVEAAAFGKPLLVIPNVGIAGGHQVDNARAIEGEGGCRVLLETRSAKEGVEDVDPEEFLRRVLALAALPEEEKAAMGKALRRFYLPDCTQRVVAAMDRAIRARNV